MATTEDHRPPEPARTTPNGYCVDCGVHLSRPTALRCRTHANKQRNQWVFTPVRARAAVQRRTARQRAEREELARLRAEVAALRRA